MINRYTLIASLSLICASPSLMAQNSMWDEYEKFKKGAQKEYEDFRDKANAEYVKFMEFAWKECNLEKPLPKPKIKEVPPVVCPKEERDKKQLSRPISIEEVVMPVSPIVRPKPQPLSPLKAKPRFIPVRPGDVPQIDSNVDVKPGTPNVPTRPKPEVVTTPVATEPTTPVEPAPVVAEEPTITVNIYGTDCQIRFADKQKFSLKNIDNKTVAKAWEALSKDKAYDATILDCLQYRDNLKLSDWAYFRLIEKFANQALGKGNEANLLAAYIYSQSGYAMKLAKNDTTLFMLIGTDNVIYGYPYVKYDNVPYFATIKEPGKILLYPNSFPKEQKMSLQMTEEPSLDIAMTPIRTLQSKRFTDAKADVCVNKNLIDYFEDYPSSANDDFMTRWAMYANAPFNESVKQQLYPALKSSIEGFSTKDAANKLLNFVQTAFEYEYDDVVWGHDRAFFAEETLYYPYCDCEDRSILFSRLVRDILGLDVVLVYYPGHLATAVAFNEDVEGDYIMLDGRKFIICDGTYINANLGRTMPGMDNKSAKVILTNR